jgi:hypothetical protein
MFVTITIEKVVNWFHSILFLGNFQALCVSEVANIESTTCFFTDYDSPSVPGSAINLTIIEPALIFLWDKVIRSIVVVTLVALKPPLIWIHVFSCQPRLLKKVDNTMLFASLFNVPNLIFVPSLSQSVNNHLDISSTSCSQVINLLLFLRNF